MPIAVFLPALHQSLFHTNRASIYLVSFVPPFLLLFAVCSHLKKIKLRNFGGSGLMCFPFEGVDSVGGYCVCQI